MAASDTAVGIIGSVVLVAVMVGVFVYEYNNVPDVDDDPDPGMDAKNPGASDSVTLSSAPGGSSTFRFAMTPDEGVSEVDVSIAWTPSAGLPVGPAGQYTYVLSDAAGNELDAGTTNGDYSFTITGASAQTYQLELSLPQGAVGGEADIEAAFVYASSDAEA